MCVVCADAYQRPGSRLRTASLERASAEGRRARGVALHVSSFSGIECPKTGNAFIVSISPICIPVCLLDEIIPTDSKDGPRKNLAKPEIQIFGTLDIINCLGEHLHQTSLQYQYHSSIYFQN
jgi:hypothetical protein